MDFPSGDNSTDTLFAGVHWNLTTLNHWNYTYYSNATLSNGSTCVLVFSPYTPLLLSNGTFLNGTSCYAPIGHMQTRSKVGLAFACLFAASFVPTLMNLRKHSMIYLPQTTVRLRTGQRWQWYWMLVVAALAVISGITGIDIDRCYLPELSIVLSGIFWFLMLSAIMAMVWESVQHWGTWQERQMIDPNPYLLQACDEGSRIKILLPLMFYFCLWMVNGSFVFNFKYQ